MLSVWQRNKELVAGLLLGLKMLVAVEDKT
jgi:hypothetical protein